MQKIKILAFAGSLRKNSFNKALLKAAEGLLPQDTEMEIFDLEGIPLFNQDTENEMVEKVKSFKTKIEAADAILIATPEYNFSIPGVLKNALDWGSRPSGKNSFDGKPLAIMGASPGTIGTARVQYHLRQVCVSLNMYPLNKPELLVSAVEDKLDASGKLSDEKTLQRIEKMLQSLVDWTKRLQ